MRPKKRVLWAFWLAFALALSPTTGFAGGKPATIDAAYPAGSVTYFVTLTVYSDGSPDMDLTPATVKTARQIQRRMDEADRAARKASQDANVPQPPILIVNTFTVTVWSDGHIEQTQPQPVTIAALEAILDRCEDNQAGEKPHPVQVTGTPTITNAKKTHGATTSPTFAAGDQCHARTDNGKRCTRSAKGTTGFCWQHAEAPNAYPESD